MCPQEILRRVLSWMILLLLGWIVFVDGSQKFKYGQKIKEFEVIHKDYFCEANAQKDNQCSQMNKNYLKFYFSIFFTIAWGGAVRTVIRTFELSIPYTVVLLISGLIMGLGTRITSTSLNFCETWAMFTKFARTPPDLILYIFLPILIFESAFSMKSHVFMTNFLSISIVALPGMLISTLFTCLACLQFLDNYQWTITQAGLFGAIISATDPVAVVAILRELGTSETLSVMIEGESLLNDGVAILLYHILKSIVEASDEEHDGNMAWDIIWQFIRIAIGGPCFGYVMGKLACFCLTLIYNDAPTEITITLVSAYLTYFVGEFYLGVSGVMAVVLLGVTLSAGSTCITPEAMHTVQLFWEMLSYLANTILFVILGIVISETAINSFEARDGYNVIFLYFALSIIRLTMLFLLSPLLRASGFDANWKNLTVMMWGGLRGAVGVCLALEVYRSKKLCKYPTVGPKFLLQTAGIVILTLLFNGTTTKWLLDYLGITTLSAGKLQDMAHTVKNLTQARIRTVLALKHDRFLADANWNVVHKYTFLKDPYHKTKDDKLEAEAKAEAKLEIEQAKADEGYILHRSDSANSKSSTKSLPNISSIPSITSAQGIPRPSLIQIHQDKLLKSAGVSVDDLNREIKKSEIEMDPDSQEYKLLMEECRCRVMKSMKISCWTQYEKGSLSEEAVKTVVSSIEEKEDTPLVMIRLADLRDYWEIKGFLPWVREKIIAFTSADKLPPKPKLICRHPFYWLTTQDWFHGLIYCIIFLNLIPISVDIYYLAKEEEAEGAMKDFIYVCMWLFTGAYFLEFLLKIIGRGCKDYCGSKWNLLDFFVLIVSIAELGVTFSEYHGYISLNPESTKATDTLHYLRSVRFLRFIRLLRWARPLLPVINRIIEVRINSRLFIGYDVGTGYVQCLEDALRFLPNMIQQETIFRKFYHILDEDRLQATKELLLLQAMHPGVVVAVKTRHAARAISGYMKEDLETMKMEGLLEEKEQEVLVSIIDGNLKKLWASPKVLKALSVDTMVENVPWAVGHPGLMEFFMESATGLRMRKGEVVYNFGDPPNGIHLVVSGLLKLHYDPTEELATRLHDHGVFPNAEYYLDITFTSTLNDYLGVGAVIGEYGYLTKLPRAASIICETNVELVHWSNAVLDKGLHHFQDPFDSLEARIWRSWGIKLATEYLHTTNSYFAWSGDKIRAHLEQGVVPVGSHFNSIEIPEYIHETILIFGEIINDETTENAVAPAIIQKTWTKVGQKPGSKISPKFLMLVEHEDLEKIEENSSKTSLQKLIINSPGIAMSLRDAEGGKRSSLSFKKGKGRSGGGSSNMNIGGSSRKSMTVEGYLRGLTSRKSTGKGVKFTGSTTEAN